MSDEIIYDENDLETDSTETRLPILGGERNAKRRLRTDAPG